MLDEDEAPIRGARVLLLPAEGAWQRGLRLLAGELGPHPAATARSDEHGLFRLRVPEAGLWALRVEAAGALAMAMPARVFLQDETLPEVILPQRGGAQRVRVLSPRGRPVAGALVDVQGAAALSNRARLSILMLGNMERFSETWELARRCAWTGEDGIARLPLGAEEQQLRITVSAAGWPRWEGREMPSVDAIEARLRSGGHVELTVAQAGRPGRTLAFLLDPFRPLATSDAQGKLRIVVPQGGPRARATFPESGEAAGVVYLLSEEGRSERLLENGLSPGSPRRIALRDRVLLEGRVRAAGRPLPTAWVWAGGVGEEPVRTGEEGRFELEIPWLWLGLPEGRLQRSFRRLSVQAAAVNHLPAKRSLPDSGGSPARLRLDDLHLHPAVRLHGEVVDSRGRPVEAATVRAQSSGASRGAASPGALAEAPSPAAELPGPGRAVTWAHSSGAFELLLAAREPHRLEARHPAHAPAGADIPPMAPGAAPQPIRLVLPAGRAVYGVVLDEHEQPVSRARVALLPAESLDLFTGPWSGAPSPLDSLHESVHTLRTDAAGRFELGDLPSGSYTLAATAPGYPWAIVPGLDVPADRRELYPLGTVILDPGHPLQGRVVDPEGAPVVGANLLYQAEASVVEYFLDAMTGQEVARSGGEVKSDADGRFLVPARRRGERLELLVTRSGFRRQVVPGVELPEEGAAEPLEIMLEPAATLAGRVVDRLGEPVRGAAVFLYETVSTIPGTSRSHQGGSGYATTGEDGGFELDSLRPGRMMLTVQHEFFLPHRHPEPLVLVAGERHPDIEIELERGETLTGRVLDPTGAPVAGARLRVVSLRRQSANEQSFAPPAAETASRPDGSYRLEGLEIGPAEVVARHPDFDESRGTVEIRRGETTLDVELEPRPGFEVSGRVITAEGEGIAGARIWARQSHRHAGRQEASTGSHGEFVFPRLSPGTYRLQVLDARTPPGDSTTGATSGAATSWVQEEESEVEVEDGPVRGLEIRLASAGSVRGRLLGLDLDDLARVHVMAMREGGPGRSGKVRFDGDYRIDALSPGAWEVTAFLPDGKTVNGRVEIASAGDEAELDLDFTRGVTVRGVALVGERPLSGAQIHLASPAHSAWTSTSAQGRFELSGLERGSYEMRIIEHRKGLSHRRTLEVSGDEEIEVRLQAGVVEGFVVDAAGGAPLPGSTVALGPQAGPSSISPPPATADEAGYFSFREVLEGSYWLRAHAPGYGIAQLEARVPADAGRPLEIALERTGGVVLRISTAVGAAWEGNVRVAALDPAGTVRFRGRFATREPGLLHLDALPPGTWELLLSTLESATVRLPVIISGGEEPPPEVGVSLSPAATLRVRLADGAGAAGESLRLTLTRADGAPERVLSWRGGLIDHWMLPGGRGEVSGLAAGSWVLRAEAADGRVWSGVASAAAGEEVDVALHAADAP